MPGNFVSSSMLSGIIELYFSTSMVAISLRSFALVLYNPQDLISSSICSIGASLKLCASGNALKRAGVIMLTRASVHCAESLVATKS